MLLQIKTTALFRRLCQQLGAKGRTSTLHGFNDILMEFFPTETAALMQQRTDSSRKSPTLLGGFIMKTAMADGLIQQLAGVTPKTYRIV
jgi:hypothetical protein